MKWIGLIAIAGGGYLWYRGQKTNSALGVVDSLSAGWTATLGDLHLGPCTGCAGAAAASGATPTAARAVAAPRDIYLGH